MIIVEHKNSSAYRGKKVTGLTVVVDVFGAISMEAYMLDKGIEKIIPVGGCDFAY